MLKLVVTCSLYAALGVYATCSLYTDASLQRVMCLQRISSLQCVCHLQCVNRLCAACSMYQRQTGGKWMAGFFNDNSLMLLLVIRKGLLLFVTKPSSHIE